MLRHPVGGAFGSVHHLAAQRRRLLSERLSPGHEVFAQRFCLTNKVLTKVQGLAEPATALLSLLWFCRLGR
jgi:hypothetical protein